MGTCLFYPCRGWKILRIIIEAIQLPINNTLVNTIWSDFIEVCFFYISLQLSQVLA